MTQRKAVCALEQEQTLLESTLRFHMVAPVWGGSQISHLHRNPEFGVTDGKP